MTYSSRLIAKLDPKHPCNKSFGSRSLSPDLLAEIAEKQFQQKLYGGFNRRNLCTTCRIALPKNNICSYCS